MSDSTGSIDHLYKQLQGEKFPPVELWNPDISDGVNIHIKRNGDWFYQGSLIQRPAMVRLFSTVLRRDGDLYYLVTPVEKIQVTIDDAPFTAVSMEVLLENDKQFLVFTNNVGDKTIAGKKHPIFVNYDAETGEPTPYVEVRQRLNALITRPVYYQMAELCVERDGCYGVWSGEHFFELGRVED